MDELVIFDETSGLCAKKSLESIDLTHKQKKISV